MSKAKELTNKYDQAILFENTSFEELDNQGKYDVVLLGEVLEHFSEPIKILHDIKSLLNSEGKVVITTPNMPSLRNRLKFALLGIFPDNNPEHKYYFDYKRFSKVVLKAGYDISYFKTRFASVLNRFRLIAIIERFLLFWFPAIFPKSGDTIFAVIFPKTTIS